MNSTFTRVILGIALVATLSGFLSRATINFLSHRYDVAAEAIGLYGILELADGKPLYASRTERPYHAFIYNPVHAWFSATLLKSVAAQGLRERVLIIRLISLASLFAACLLLHKVFIKPLAVSKTTLAFAWVLALPKFADYATAVRNDLFTLALEIGALCAFVYWIRKPRFRTECLFIALWGLAFATRPTAIAILGSAVLWLLLQRRIHCALRFASLGLGLTAAMLAVGNWSTGGEFIDQAFISNMRPFVRADLALFTPSVSSFLACYVLFATFVWKGIKVGFGNEQKGQQQLLLLVMGLQACQSLILFFRVGGDTNYFFGALFSAIPFCCMGIDNLMKPFRFNEKKWLVALTIQAALIAVVLFSKTLSAAKVAFLPYEQAAERVRTTLLPHGYLIGSQGANLTIHLRGWSYHGPEVSYGVIGFIPPRSFDWVLPDLKKAIAEGTIQTVLWAGTECKESGPIFRHPYLQLDLIFADHFGNLEKWHDWLCVYRLRSHANSNGRTTPTQQGVQ
ncbi:MAG: hypothetical protein HY537_00835 [Deltaproteobacteria bacterium]|nr:hypothetical protein [Deltaproteobacteria bacterium]